jgi:hypothetical protein
VAVAIVQDWIAPETDRSTANYDAITAALMAQNEPVDGLRVHGAGFSGSGFRIFEIWESREHFDRFLEERLMPLVMAQEGSSPTPPTVTEYELHNVIVQ